MKRWRWWTGPIVLCVLAALVAAYPSTRAKREVELGPIDLHPGATRTAEFHVGYADGYAIGIELDQRQAIKLIPSVAEPRTSSLCAGLCTSGSNGWPVRLGLKLTADGVDVSRTIEEDTQSGAGGEYAGDETFTRPIAYVNLRPGIRYHLTVRSLADGTALRSANPRLIVFDTRAGLGDEQALISLACLAATALLLLVAGIWIVLGFWLSRRARVDA